MLEGSVNWLRQRQKMVENVLQDKRPIWEIKACKISRGEKFSQKKILLELFSLNEIIKAVLKADSKW